MPWRCCGIIAGKVGTRGWQCSGGSTALSPRPPGASSSVATHQQGPGSCLPAPLPLPLLASHRPCSGWSAEVAALDTLVQAVLAQRALAQPSLGQAGAPVLVLTPGQPSLLSDGLVLFWLFCLSFAVPSYSLCRRISQG